ncbi:nefa-interacting nuclear protein nip30 [Diplodia corticola]|uniref:Nefa-interacting nuclear protein nip30 n=1 Tax=Diplodia corticola TaxID=236234 RepID=A0A1J9RE64_9PEZI|nr:nefa-interacting nuclear protein nip30 [Diplodia corticola]OJD38705.1 nefa-interacting nuclear protein nip30 [Diplodia corticola]
MSSGFVSAGTNDQPVERDAEWLQAQQDLEAQRRRREEESKQTDGKSLYEVLQANKAKKQEAFEESIKLKNQFRALDEDEAEFLDSVLESTRAKEAALKKETTEQLDAFRRHQEEVERAARLTGATDGDQPAEEEHWASAGRKRKKARDKESLMGIKIRRTSSVGEKGASSNASPKTDTKSPDPAEKEKEIVPSAGVSKPENVTKTATGTGLAASEKTSGVVGSTVPKETQAQKPKPTPAALGLGGYSSDEDD